MINRKWISVFLMTVSCLVAFFPLLLRTTGFFAVFDGLSDSENRDLFLGGLLNLCALVAMFGGCLSYAVSRSPFLYVIGCVLFVVSAGISYVYTGGFLFDLLVGTPMLLALVSIFWPSSTKGQEATAAQAG